MFFGKLLPNAYTTPGNPNRGHGGRTRVLDDGTVYANCTCGWSATGRGQVHTSPNQLLTMHLSSITARN